MEGFLCSMLLLESAFKDAYTDIQTLVKSLLSKKYCNFLGVFLFGICMPAFVVHGQAGISVTPLTFELTGNPGDVLTNAIRVTNPTGGSVIFEIEIEDFTTVGETGEVVVDAIGDEAVSMRNWITTDPKRFTLEADQTQSVSFDITIPKDAEPGGHYVSILASVKGTAGVTGAAVSQKVATLVLLSVSGTIREELLIRDFTVPRFSEKGPILFVARLDNTGSVHVRPIGFIAISNFWGKHVGDIPLPARRVLPGATRRIEMQWDKSYPVGKFTATFVGSFGNSNTPISSITTFWVFPWKIALEIFGALVLLVVALIITRRRFRAALRVLFKGEETMPLP